MQTQKRRDQEAFKTVLRERQRYLPISHDKNEKNIDQRICKATEKKKRSLGDLNREEYRDQDHGDRDDGLCYRRPIQRRRCEEGREPARNGMPPLHRDGWSIVYRWLQGLHVHRCPRRAWQKKNKRVEQLQITV
jgi:hypothetical protein